MARGYQLPTGISLRVDDRTGRDLWAHLDRFLLAHAKPTTPRASSDFQLALSSAPRGSPLRPPPGAHALRHDTGDSGPSLHWVDEDGALFFCDEVHGFRSRWSVPLRAAELVSSAPDADAFFVQEAYAAVRWMVCTSVFGHGGTLLHAGGFAHGGRGVLVLGDKGSGKTTLTTAALSLGAAYVTSDRAFVWIGAGTSRAAGWICTYRVDPAAIANALDPTAHARFSAYVARHAASPGFIYDGKARIPPLDFMAIVGAPAAPDVELHMIAELRGGSGELVIEDLPPDERAEVLRRHHVSYALPAGLAGRSGASSVLADLPDVTFIRIHGHATPSEIARRLLDLLRP